MRRPEGIKKRPAPETEPKKSAGGESRESQAPKLAVARTKKAPPP